MKKTYILCTVVFMLIGISSYAQLTTLLNFDGLTSGKYSLGSLISDGTYMYGMNEEGGTNNMGTIFKIMPDGTGYIKLLDFAGVTNGSGPFGDLISDGTFLYGITRGGGANNVGTIFKILPDGTGYIKLHDFAGDPDGSYPAASLISDGVFLYGTTGNGGANGGGTIYKIMLDGTGYVKLLDFAGVTNGSDPFGALFSDGTYLYGMTSSGGANGIGTIYKILPDGTGYVKLLDFAGSSNGSNPYGSLISDGTYLYGMTREGGANNVGTIFKILPDGTGYIKLHDFVGLNGRKPFFGSLISDGSFLYGMTEEGGANSGANNGTIFKIMTDGTGYSKLIDFDDTNGRRPMSSLIYDGTFLYGMTYSGGTNDLGVVFKYCPVSATATNTGAYCTGATIQLNSTGGDSYEWSGPLSYTSTTQNPSINSSTADMSGVYTVTVTNSAGCTASATTNVIVNDCASIEENNLNATIIFPNPTTGLVNISTTINGLQLLSITNILGEVVFKEEINLATGSPFTIDLSEKPSGIYFLRLDNSIKRIIKQ